MRACSICEATGRTWIADPRIKKNLIRSYSPWALAAHKWSRGHLSCLSWQINTRRVDRRRNDGGVSLFRRRCPGRGRIKTVGNNKTNTKSIETKYDECVLSKRHRRRWRRARAGKTAGWGTSGSTQRFPRRDAQTRPRVIKSFTTDRVAPTPTGLSGCKNRSIPQQNRRTGATGGDENIYVYNNNKNNKPNL